MGRRPHRPDRPGTTIAGLVAGAIAVIVTGVVGLTAIAWTVLDVGAVDEPEEVGAGATLGASSDGEDAGYTVWDRNDDGSPVRWDPCTPIDIVVADAGAPKDWRDDLEAALELLRETTGMSLRILGDTDESPAADRSPYQPDLYGERWAPVLVAWASPHEADLPLRDIDRGIGSPVAVGRTGERTYVSGQVVLNLDRDDLEVGGDDRGTSWGATVLHELIHVLGLGHVEDPQALMSTFPGTGPVELGSGDRAGLRAVGAERGCRDVPTPRPVELPPLTIE